MIGTNPLRKAAAWFIGAVRIDPVLHQTSPIEALQPS